MAPSGVWLCLSFLYFRVDAFEEGCDWFFFEDDAENAGVFERYI